MMQCLSYSHDSNIRRMELLASCFASFLKIEAASVDHSSIINVVSHLPMLCRVTSNERLMTCSECGRFERGGSSLF